jgi:hypothetical protein
VLSAWLNGGCFLVSNFLILRRKLITAWDLLLLLHTISLLLLLLPLAYKASASPIWLGPKIPDFREAENLISD